MNSIVQMTDITKRFGPVIANNRCTFSVEEGEIHSLLGENGAGKTTLMNILFGMYHADSGEIYIKGEKCRIHNTGDAFHRGLGMIHQHFMLIPNMTVLQNIVLGQEIGNFRLNYGESRRQINEITKKYGLELDLDARVENISVGMKQRVEIVKTLYRGAEVLVLDEPTAVLTPQESNSLMNILLDMKRQGKTIIFITHKLNETMQIADRATILRNGTVTATVKIAETETRELARFMVGREILFELEKTPFRPGKPLLEVDNLKLLPHAKGTVSLTVKQGEILGIAGVDGNGQLELEEMIMGLRPKLSGTIRVEGQEAAHLFPLAIRRMGVGCIPSDRQRRAMLPGLSLSENFLLGFQSEKKYSRKGFINAIKLNQDTINCIEKFTVKTAGPAQNIADLSGGNQQKIVLGREVSSEYHLILAAQPGRGLDIGAVEYIHTHFLRLRSEGKGILLISADLEEILKISDRIAVIYKGELMECKAASQYTIEELGLLMAGKKPGREKLI
ncbi:MAG: ABC transporter ATP-binding protein [Treponema sp.]|jgi:simple sugar transport system ATP-binding protein|nr:ABC transporter ATP-binding protein [Treponema sp.]